MHANVHPSQKKKTFMSIPPPQHSKGFAPRYASPLKLTDSKGKYVAPCYKVGNKMENSLRCAATSSNEDPDPVFLLSNILTTTLNRTYGNGLAIGIGNLGENIRFLLIGSP